MPPRTSYFLFTRPTADTRRRRVVSGSGRQHRRWNGGFPFLWVGDASISGRLWASSFSQMRP